MTAEFIDRYRLVHAAARRVGRDPHAVAEEIGMSPAVVAPLLARRGVPVLTPGQVADLKARYAARPAGVGAREWFAAAADTLGVSVSVVRRAVYGMARYYAGAE